MVGSQGPDGDDGPGTASAAAPDEPAAEDRDEAGGRRDVVAGGRDRAAGRRDRAATVRDLAAGLRDEVAGHRDQAADHRDRDGDRRDEEAGRRDSTADRRDLAAERRDRMADQFDRAEIRREPGVDVSDTSDLDRGAQARREAAWDRWEALQDRLAGAHERTRSEIDRDSGATHRTEAEHDRSIALSDRGGGASERGQAEHDRHASLEDRDVAAQDREHASLDGLTSAYLRGPGRLELAREVVRAHRTGQPLGLAFVDVDNLKAVNDGRGHAAGDRLLVRVADTLRARLRPYDLVIRYGGDEFVCALPNLDEAGVAGRLAPVNVVLGDGPEPGSVTIGTAALRSGDSVDDLVGRADAALYRARRRRRLNP